MKDVTQYCSEALSLGNALLTHAQGCKFPGFGKGVAKVYSTVIYSGVAQR